MTGEIIGQKQKGDLTKITKLAIVGFIASLAFAYINTIWAVYMDSFVNSIVLVGFISAFLTLISFLSYFFFIPIIEKQDKSKIYYWSLLTLALGYILFAINTKFYIFVILASLITIITTFRVTSFGIIIKDKSSKTQLSKNEGVIFTFLNLAWVLGPLIAGYIASQFGIRLVFVLSAIFVIIAFLLFRFFKIKDKNIKKKIDKNLIKNLFGFFKDKEKRLAYFIGGGVNLWWVLIYLFVPLFIIRQGLSVSWIGYFLFAVAVPLVLFEYKFSKLVGKKGFKKIFQMGFLIVAVFSFLCFFIGNIYIIMILLTLASIGMAMLEPTTEAYFFDILKKKEELRYYGPYKTKEDVNNFLGKILASSLLIILPFKYIFLLFALFMLIMFFLSSKTKRIIEKNL
ncbi:MFS transporter [Candidatus Pacearchaeota archaeon]|nr:MFS transporter [Candidatus Pacearchaeota archaeon]